MPAPQLSPAALPANFVWRSYLGGSVLRQFRGLSETPDDHFPEDWLASTVRARNGSNTQHEHEGLSRVHLGNNREALLTELLADQPGFWFGAGRRAASPNTGVLWKLLDSSVRLQLQAHPSAAFAAKHLSSSAGKTECWYILDTRKDREADVYLGFQHPPTRAEWRRMIEGQKVEEMLACFERIEVHPGDCYVVPAGTPHAIGASIFMLELQEPTDWVVRCERTNAGFTLPPEACFMNLDLETCLDVFDYTRRSVNDVRVQWRQRPREVFRNERFCEQEIIQPAHHRYFRLHRLTGSGSANWAGDELMLLLVMRGHGTLKSAESSRALERGQTWLLPGSMGRWEWIDASEDWEILLAKLPLTEQV